MTAASPTTPVFAETALRSQHVFRRIMEAMARPGLVVSLGHLPAAQAPLIKASEAALLTLCDFETTLWIAPTLGAAADHLRFQTDARLVSSASSAAFALVEAQDLDLAIYHPGTPNYPDRGATVVVQCEALSGGAEFLLAGPGIASVQPFAIFGLPAKFPDQLRTNRAQFPLGVDLIFASGTDVLALPRSTRIMEAR